MQELVLKAEDLQTLDNLIKKIPFEHAFPLFQFLTGKLQEGQKAAEAKTEPKADNKKSK
jgi:hypothetical protein